MKAHSTGAEHADPSEGQLYPEQRKKKTRGINSNSAICIIAY